MAEFAEEWNDEVVERVLRFRPQSRWCDHRRRSATRGRESWHFTRWPRCQRLRRTRFQHGQRRLLAVGASGPIDDKYIKVGQRIIERYDKNNDKMLTASEWEKMLMSPADADANRDGRITIDEYALWMQSRERK